MRQTSDPFAWLAVSAEDAARRLLGCELESTIDGKMVRVRIVETEAYDQLDEASHTFRGKTERNAAMYKSAGHLYVYFTYGMHYCCNVVSGSEDEGAGVLIRAVEPTEGSELIEERRGKMGIDTTNGPGKVAQALAIDRSFSGHNLSQSPIKLIKRPALPSSAVTVGPRIGISRAVHELRRFYITDNRYVSKR